MMFGRTRPLAVVLLLVGGGCMGAVDSTKPRRPRGAGTPPAGQPEPGAGQTGSPDPNGSGPAPTIPGAASGACEEAAPQVTAARRLTREQYAATVRDLLGAITVPPSAGDRLPADDGSDGLFVSPATLIVSPAWAENAMTAAEEIARVAVTRLPDLLPCPESEGERCARRFLEGFAKRAFRRPVTGDEVEALLAVFQVGASAGGGFAKGIELAMQATLQSPFFLYRLELGQAQGSSSGVIKLTPHEVASRLSYGLWGTMPDQALMEAADAGRLQTADEIGAQARRLVADPRARQTMIAFVARWFGLELLDEVMKDPAVYPQWNETVIAAMKAEASTFIEKVVFEGDGRFETLISAPYSFVDAKLAPLYGVTAPAGAPGKVTLPDRQRAGLLTSVGVLSAHTFSDESAAIHRGKFIRERLLCTNPPDPPADLMVEPPTPQAGVTTRQRLIQHIEDPACQPCHEYMDPIGFGFENYDGLGRWRTQDHGKPVDSRGKLAFSDVDGPFDGAVELASKLSASASVRDCVAGTFLRFTAATESQIDPCSQRKLRQALEASRGDLRELMVAITRTDSFQYRRAAPGEVMP